MKVCTIVGARPQFIKAAPLSRTFREHGGITEILIHTGQHYDDNMSQVFFDELQIPVPDYQLGIGSGPHGVQTGRMLQALEEVLVKEAPKWVLVYGDTNSTLAGALAASKIHLPVAHVEAGLRSFNRKMPEEINRVLTDHVSDMLFAPTVTAVANLGREGISGDCVQLVGDIMYDAVLLFGARAHAHSKILSSLGLKDRKYILATLHRAENTDNPERLRTIIAALSKVAKLVPVVLPLHPRTRSKLQAQSISTDEIRLLEPVGYLDMMALSRQAALICTDSGGLQKEAYFHHVPCLTLRDETEWTELVALGYNRLALGKDCESLVREISTALTRALPDPAPDIKPYGDGRSSPRICEALLSANPRTLSHGREAAQA